MDALERAIAHIGSQAEMARLLGVKPQAVHQWLTKSRPVPVQHAVQIEKLTASGVTLSELRPDLAELFGAA